MWRTLVRGSRSDHQIYGVHTYSSIPDAEGEEHMEWALHYVYPGSRQEETCHMDGWPQRRANRNRCTIHVCGFGPVYLTFLYSDLANAKSNWNKTPGYTKDETEAFQNILNPPESAAGVGKFVDVWRQNHPEDKHYTYFSYRFDCRTKGLGWRLDMCKLLISASWLILNQHPSA